MNLAEGIASEYWVYENWTAEHKAVVHAGACGFCKHGHGTDRRKPRGDANGKWYGPYPTSLPRMPPHSERADPSAATGACSGRGRSTPP